jgi:Na+-transporting methylmalonyl-CoA/oxaloacetate decarboxylase beta subunit
MINYNFSFCGFILNMEIINKLYDMTAFGEIIDEPRTLLMLFIAMVMLYLGIKKRYEPLLLVPIAFGLLLANFPGGQMSVTQATDENGILHLTLLEIAKDHGIMNLLYYALIKTGLLPPLIFMGVGAMTDFGPMLRNLRLAFFGAAAQIGIFSVLVSAVAMGFTLKEAGALGIIGGADGPTAIYTSIILARNHGRLYEIHADHFDHRIIIITFRCPRDKPCHHESIY